MTRRQPDRDSERRRDTNGDGPVLRRQHVADVFPLAGKIIEQSLSGSGRLCS